MERALVIAGYRPCFRAFVHQGLGATSPAAQPIASPHFTILEGSPTLRDIEMSYIQAVLDKHNGNKPAASKELGISLKTLYNKINQLQQS